MIVKICDLVIKFDLLLEDKFQTMVKYQCDEEPKYFVKCYHKDIERPSGKCISTQFYDLYKTKDSILQFQTLNEVYVGAIEYKGNEVNVYLKYLDSPSEYLLTQYALVYFLKRIPDVLFMHGSSLVINNKGIIFSAKSGTGKSTHTRLWQKLSDCIMLNDDKNIVKICGEKLYLYPNPFSGKHQVDNNIISTLDTIVFLYQSKQNEFKEITALEKFKLIASQVELPSNQNKESWNNVIDQLLKLPIYSYGCNMEDEAFEVIYNRLKQDIGI